MKTARSTLIQAAPIALRREDASQAMGISVSLFESLVRQGRMPKPRMLANKRVGWLYAELQRCAEALPVSDLPPGPGRRPKSGPQLHSLDDANEPGFRGHILPRERDALANLFNQENLEDAPSK